MSTTVARILSRDRTVVTHSDYPAHRDCLTCNPATRAQKLFSRKALKARTTKHIYCPACTKRELATTTSQEEPSASSARTLVWPSTTRHAILLRNDFDAMFDHPRSSFREVNPPRLYSAFAPTPRSASGSTVCLHDREVVLDARGYPVFSESY